MPYIDPARREVLEHVGELPVTPGELNFCITSLAHRYLKAKGLTYANGNEIVGALDSAKLEFYRTVLAPYEDKKRTENGSISEFDTETVQSPAGMTPAAATAVAPDLVTALREAIRAEMGGGIAPVKRRVAKQKLTPPTPHTVAPAPSTSSVRRRAQVIGKQPGADDASPPAVAAAPPIERPKSSLRREAERKVEPPKGVDKHVADVWRQAAEGNGEDDF